MEAEIASSEVVHAVSPVAAHSHDRIVHVSSSEGLVTNHNQFTSSNSIRIQVEEPAVEEAVITSRSTILGRVLTMEQFEKVIAFVVLVVTQMSGSTQKQKNICLGLFAAILAVHAMENLVMTHTVIKFGIAFNSTKFLCFYLLLCILKPEWLSWYGFVMVCISATTYTFYDELKTKFTWCCEKGVLVIGYVIDKVLVMKGAIGKDQTSPASAPSRASV